MKTILSAFAATAALVAAADAAILDFEDFGTTNGDLAMVMPDSFETEFGIRFTSTDGIRVVEVGGDPQSGFVPNDTPNPADAFGEFFLGTAFDDRFTDLTIEYLAPVDGYSFELGDIDDDEVITIRTYGAGDVLLNTDVITSGDPGTGNASVYAYGVSNLGQQIFKIVIEGERGSNRLGIAFDNFSTNIDRASVPVPAALPLFGAALAGFGAMRRRKAK